MEERGNQTYIAITREAAECQGSLGSGGSPLASAGLRDWRRRVSGRRDRGDRDGRSGSGLGSAVSHSRRLVAELGDVGSLHVSDRAAAVGDVTRGAVRADGDRAGAVVGSSVDRASTHDRRGGGGNRRCDVGSAVHRWDGRLAILRGRVRRANHHGGGRRIGARCNHRRRSRLLGRAGGGSIRRGCGRGRVRRRRVLLTRSRSHKGNG